MDLFSANMTVEEQLEDLKNNIKNTYIKQDIIGKKTKIKLFYGSLDNIGNSILVITSPPPAKFFESAEDKILYSFLNELNINNYFVSYFNLIPSTKINKQDIKDFGHWIRKLTDIIDPKFILCVGENAQLSYFKRKFILREHHGKIIGDYNSIPIYAIQQIMYYQKQSTFEDVTYKNYMKDTDWKEIIKKYKED